MLKGKGFRLCVTHPKLPSDLDLEYTSDLGFGLRGRFEAAAILAHLKEREGG